MAGEAAPSENWCDVTREGNRRIVRGGPDQDYPERHERTEANPDSQAHACSRGRNGNTRPAEHRNDGIVASRLQAKYTHLDCVVTMGVSLRVKPVRGDGASSLSYIRLPETTKEHGCRMMGPPDSFRANLESNHAASYAWALSCCGYDHAEAEDVLQTVYLKVLQGKAVHDGRATFRTWLFSVIRNTAASHRRWNALRHLRLVPLDEGVSRSDPAESLDRSEGAARLRRALDALPRRQREVLHLVFYEDLTIVEAAMVVGVSVGSARTHYERGKKRLRELMETK